MIHTNIHSGQRRSPYVMTLSQYQLLLVISFHILPWTPSIAFCVPGKVSVFTKYVKLAAVENDRDPRIPAAVRRKSTSASTMQEDGPYVYNSDDATLGVAHRVLQRTLVPALAGAVLKATPEDFVVVEILLPNQEGAKTFSPVDTESPVPEDIRKPLRHKIPPRDLVAEAIQVWKERWPTPLQQAGAADPPQQEPARTMWNLGKGFDAVAAWLEGPAALRLQDWLLLVADRATFDAAEADGGNAQDEVFLPPPLPPREILLPCPPNLDKAGRTELHGVFRTHMPYFSTRAIMPGSGSGWRGGGDSVRSSTEAIANDLTYFEVSHELTKRNSRQSWPKGRGEYLEFSVYKAGRSTHEATDAICRRLDVNRGRLTYAGAKDRRALTAQKMRCWRLPAEDIHEAQASGMFAAEGIAFSDYRWVDEGFKLGQLRGNHFEVLLRPPHRGWGQSEAVGAAAADGGVSAADAFRRLRDEGFVNFFGAQRFGRDGRNSVDVGMTLLRCDWAGAVRKILAPHPADTREVAIAKEACFRRRGDEDVDFSAALGLLPRGAFLERSLLTALVDSGGKDPLGSVLALPRPMRSLFTQAYQSLLWNEAASLRMGDGYDRLKAVLGDLVLVAGDRPLTAWDTRPEGGGGSESSGGRGGKRGGRGGRVRGRGTRRSATKDDDEAHPVQEVIAVSAEQAEQGIFGIEHVVIPLPGHSVSFPSNTVGDRMLGLLERDGVDSVILEGHPQRAFDLEGAYRHVVVHPQDLAVEPVALGGEGANRQNDSTGLEMADDRRSKGTKSTPPPDTASWLRGHFRDEISRRFRGAVGRNPDGFAGDGDGVSGQGGGATARSKTAIRVSFDLPRGSYATTLLQHLTGEGLGWTGGTIGSEDEEFEVE